MWRIGRAVESLWVGKKMRVVLEGERLMESMGVVGREWGARWLGFYEEGRVRVGRDRKRGEIPSREEWGSILLFSESALFPLSSSNCLLVPFCRLLREVNELARLVAGDEN
ncbi:hypothetical protein COLO4_21413 [Corchorus olitorius]|uniref:Uncharacterized protein n=1 Tax=Corchorus olitorius TaxID=93759 RepID=A0A1R3ITG0_9ROSI|nr:hypothetical protein COLO4_21413 [Corchorus olitorius]